MSICMRSGRILTIIIVTYLSEDVVKRALAAIEPAWRRGFVECIVVDNSPNTETVDVVRREHPWATLIKSERNVGYGAGCNLGLARVATRYVLFMNPDVVVQSDDLLALVDFMKANPMVGLAAPALMQADGHVQSAGGLLTPFRLLAGAVGVNGRYSQRPMLPGQPPCRTDWVCGAVLAAPTELIREMGGFDPRFFLYFEETDLCKRVLDRRREVWAVNNVVVHHQERASTERVEQEFFMGCIAEHYFKSRFYYLVKHYGWPSAIASEVGELAILSCRDVLKRMRGNPDTTLKVRWDAPLFKLPERTV